ncbi:phage holin family protein [Dyadobacter sp. CY323]|uniref:phage holin family protein n=1 Tax=Dyadobacter sp. CY323 TaxID=2907302 RepID=UPI001F1D97E5|nr:phage holin family protein [Dyadobacter sp. CY323]MCE6988532.1 phage holin family protein [Dyadobacter sp. CY323]
MKLLLRLVISTLAVLLAANLIPGVVVSSIGTAVIVAIVLGILNTFLKPVLQILALPITILTLGLFYFVVNVFIIYIATFLVNGFAIDNFISALLFGLVVSVVSSILGMFLD